MRESRYISRVSRSDGKVSKQAILEATLNIILRDGIRQVKYKSVADHAGVTNSAVAYYFDGIPGLIEEAFLYYFEKYADDMAQVRAVGEYTLASFPVGVLDSADGHRRVRQAYVQSLLALFLTDSPEITTYLQLDRIFRNESLTNPRLYKVLAREDQRDIDALSQFFTRLAIPSPVTSAVHFMSLLWFLGEKAINERQHTEFQARAVFLMTDLLERLAQAHGVD